MIIKPIFLYYENDCFGASRVKIFLPIWCGFLSQLEVLLYIMVNFVIFASPINCQMMGRLYVILLYKGDWVRRLVGVNNIHLLTIVDFEQVLEPSCLLL